MDNYITNFLGFVKYGVSLTDILRQEVQRVLNELLKTELTEFLKYAKYDPKGYNSGNSRNGYYERTVKSVFGELVLTIPRDRNGEFSTKLFSPYQKICYDLGNEIIQMFKQGSTTGEISKFIEKTYGFFYSPQSVSNLTQVLQEEVEKFHKRQLEKRYIAVYCDATYIPLKRNTVQKEALHVLLGITPDGRKEVLDYAVAANENNSTYKQLLKNIKERGAEEVLLFVTDGFGHLGMTCNEVFPKAKHQCCWVHVSRNIRAYVRKSDWNVMAEEVKGIYTVDNKEQATDRMGEYLRKWYSKYPKLWEKMYDPEELFAFMILPERIRKSFYTTNALEGLNNLLKRQAKKKEMFPNENSMERFVCAVYENYNEGQYFKSAIAFEETSIEVSQIFDEVYGVKLNLEENVYT